MTDLVIERDGSTTSHWKNRRVLVAGGCGFLGAYLVPQLLEEGATVRVVDNLATGYVDNLASVSDDIDVIIDDIRNPGVCDTVAAGQDIVLNLAGLAYGMDYSRKHNGYMLVYNLTCTLNLLEAARRQNVTDYMVVSSSCVYPDDAPVPTAEIPVFTGSPERVNEGYGWAKRIQELAGTYYAGDYGMRVAIVRPFNPYGGKYRWRSEETAHVVPALVKRIMDGENPLIVWGSGQQRRNLMHARDATRLMMKVVEAGVGPAPVNIGYDDDITIAGLVQMICEISGRQPEVMFDTLRPEGRFRKCADATHLRAVTDNWVPRVGLREGLSEMIDWYHRSFATPQEHGQLAAVHASGR